jgi:hypothetical protein
MQGRVAPFSAWGKRSELFFQLGEKNAEILAWCDTVEGASEGKGPRRRRCNSRPKARHGRRPYRLVSGGTGR